MNHKLRSPGASAISYAESVVQPSPGSPDDRRATLGTIPCYNENSERVPQRRGALHNPFRVADLIVSRDPGLPGLAGQPWAVLLNPFGVFAVFVPTRAPLRTFLENSGDADFQECPAGRG